jgi:putative spermidine/putrescine transport system substrate-binding protein
MKFSLRAAALAASFIGLGMTYAQAQSEPLTVFVSGGAFADAMIESFVKPFEQETGIKVNAVKSEMGLPRWSMAVETNTVDFDVALTAQGFGIQLSKAGAMTPIDYSIYDKHELEGLRPEFRAEWGVAAIVNGIVLAYDTGKLAEGKRPQSWVDFWNTKDFPGTRTLMAPYIGAASLEEALIADGVPLDKIYPIDIDRAFRKLDEIKPEIRKWWESASEAQQMFNAGIVDMGNSFDGRIVALQKAGKPVGFTFNQAKYYASYWAIPKGAKHAAEAQKFIEFATRGKNQATLSKLMGYSPSNSTTFEHLPKELAATLITNPDNIKNAYPMNMEWYAEVGPDGKTNTQRITERWQEWIIK